MGVRSFGHPPRVPGALGAVHTSGVLGEPFVRLGQVFQRVADELHQAPEHGLAEWCVLELAVLLRNLFLQMSAVSINVGITVGSGMRSHQIQLVLRRRVSMASW